MTLRALEKALQLRTRDDAQHIYEPPSKLINSQAIERATRRLQALDSFAGRQRAALQLAESMENPALLRRVEMVKLALRSSRQTDLPQLSRLRASAQLLFAPLHILQEGRGLLTELTDADDA